MQSTPLKLTLPFALCGLLSPQSAWSATAYLYVELPRFSHRPYVAVWIENASDKSFVTNVAAWYDKDKGIARNKQWMVDMRQWWRKTGGLSSTAMDGATGASRSSGVHTIDLSVARISSALKPGDYEIVIEAVREHGGHEVLRVPISWPPKSVGEATFQGKQELGRVRLSVGP
jgi:hypothetical protein